MTMTIEITAVPVAAEQHPNDNPPPPPPLPLRTTARTTKTTKTKTKGSSSTRPSTTTTTSNSAWLACRPSNMSSVIIMVIAFLFLLPVVYVGQTAITGKKVEFNVSSESSGGGGKSGFSFGIVQPDPAGILPPDLMGSVYAEGDFRNAQGIAPTYWNCSTDGNCDSNQIWGPCYAPHGHVHWKQEVATASAAMTMGTKSTSSSSAASMPPHYFYNHDEQHTSGSVWNAHPTDPNDVANTCRPGFLIIGAGKCGTSSLYHYLVSHPRVLPAQHKQIHYFKYYYMRHTLKWYYSYFPNAISYLASGALMTGEASPGYLPYPDVPNRIRETMGVGATPRVIVVGRNPLERAYSSYKYNYASPNMDAMKQGRVTGIHAVDSRHGKNSKNGSNNSSMKYNTTYYEQFVFSFEEMLRAELSVLRKCLDPQHGAAIVQAKETWGSQSWAAAAYSRRNETGLGPMADLDGFCYGDEVNATVPRVQWAELMARNPHKVIINKDLHLVQSLLGRSIYTLPLEWWYAVFDKEDIYFVCTEELRDLSGAPLNALGSFLGLPTSYNFSMAVGEGAFNVAGHKGYDKEVSWDEIEREEAHEDDESSSSPIPLSAEFRQEVEEFLRPYNERLYALTGRRCNW